VTETYRVFALRYGTRDAKRAEHFINQVSDPEASMPMDYFVWVAQSPDRTVLIDTGFKPDVGGRRGRTHLRSPAEALRLVGIDPSAIQDIIISHLHYDHAGTLDEFPRARAFLQEDELEFVTGRGNERSRGAFEVDDVVEVIRRLYDGRVLLQRGWAGPWPGLAMHQVAGHTPGTQVVRVRTERGWVVLAADASHYYENMETNNPFRGTHDVERCIEGFGKLRELADSADHIVPGHDPDVMRRYPAVSPELEGIAITLDLPPAGS
jgi:glyoxylase-like metal-dependent hydrolase (beta-lactamase superfamily II)